MVRFTKIALLYILLPCAHVTAAIIAYEYRVRFPRTIAGRRVHRVTLWSQDDSFQRERAYYAYIDADGKEAKHGPFQNFDHGHLVQQADYRDGKLNGTITYWNLFGERTQEVYYVNGAPHGWAHFMSGKLFEMRQDVLQAGRSVAAKSFANGQYSHSFNCGELINAAIVPASGQITPIPDASKRACADAPGGNASKKEPPK